MPNLRRDRGDGATTMNFKRHLDIKKIENKEIDVAGEDELQKVRIVTLEKGNLKITLKGERDTIEGFKTGDTVGVKITNSQTELFKAEEEESDDDS